MSRDPIPYKTFDEILFMLERELPQERFLRFGDMHFSNWVKGPVSEVMAFGDGDKGEIVTCLGVKSDKPYKFEYIDEVGQIDHDLNDEMVEAMKKCQESFNKQYWTIEGSTEGFTDDESRTWTELMECARQEERDTDPGIGPNTLSIQFDEEKTPVTVVKAKRRSTKCYVCLTPNPAVVQDTYQSQRNRAISCPEGCIYPEIEE